MKTIVVKVRRVVESTRQRIAHEAILSRPTLFGAPCLACIFIAYKLVSRHWAAGWQPAQRMVASGEANGWALVVLAAAVAWSLYRIEARRTARPIRTHCPDTCSKAVANAAVARVCDGVILELAQPLTGIIVYSELLTAGEDFASDAQRRELYGLREGALRLEQLLVDWRATVASARPLTADRDLADEILTALSRQRSRAPESTLAHHPTHTR